jgi:TolA-binding protein
MTTSLEPQDSDRALRHLCKLARATFTDELSAREQAGWSRLKVKVAGRPRPRHTLAVGFGLAAAAAAVALLAHIWYQTPPSLGFRVVDEAGVPHAAPDLASAGRIEFSDGSQVAVAAEARASVTAIDARGARIRLEHGRLAARFVQLPQASWSVAAGPYQVLVTGTAFDVSWTPDTRALELWLRHGSVLVKGPNTGQGLAVVAGQHLLASATTGQIVLDAMAPAAPAALPVVPTAPTPAAGLAPIPSPPAERPAASSRESSRPQHAVPAARAPAPEPSPTWPQSLVRGDFQRILDEAMRRGLDAVLSGATSADLAAFADAARYGSRNDLAQQALLAQRQRFPHSLAGRDAAFFLGTLDESRAGREARTSALQWYGRYLAENPTGSYSGQAMGRRLVLFESLHDLTAARETAAFYLAKFPSGPYAAKAKRIVESEF